MKVGKEEIEAVLIVLGLIALSAVFLIFAPLVVGHALCLLFGLEMGWFEKYIIGVGILLIIRALQKD